MKLVILGRPTTKKNSMQIITLPGRRPLLVPSSAYKAWVKEAVRQLREQYTSTPMAAPLNMRATVYRDRRVGDLGNYLAAVCDAVQPAFKRKDGQRVVDWPGVVLDDKWIMGFDGSRLEYDKNTPRVEIELTDLDVVNQDADAALPYFNCTVCRGSGGSKYESCSACNGTGRQGHV